MTYPSSNIVSFPQFVTTLKKRWWLFVIPACGLTVFAAVYATLRPDTWSATQGFVLRNEVVGTSGKQGRFESSDSLKTAQETILEVARNHELEVAVLTEIGPPPGYAKPDLWPTEEDVERLRNATKVAAPKGTEFGHSEVIYVSVADRNPDRALRLVKAVCSRLDDRLKDLRNLKAQSVIAELDNTLRLAESDLEAATATLESMEKEIGSDLGELRILNDSGAGDSNLRAALNEIKNELRQARINYEINRQLEDHLVAARQDTARIVATPNRLLESQPSLRKLKDGLVDAQLRTAELLGTLTGDHPKVRAALAAEQEVRDDLHAELEVALRGIQTDRRVSETLTKSLEQQLVEAGERLDRLAAVRARYSNLVADVQHRSAIVEQAEKELADARASQAAAESVSVMTKLAEARVGHRPLGPGRATIVACGAVGGLLTGLGLIFLAVPPNQTRGRRWTDMFPLGRRASDLASGTGGRRASDPRLPSDNADNPREACCQMPGDARNSPDLAGGSPSSTLSLAQSLGRIQENVES